ncbi:LOW QUALITY PROTEIN: (+)-neomenthol dehydrogenase [Cryptomeria japonica]|uniref:LOW QUALITY PROTEIN: (+)-neomenthol dehydrogenase n=1 Tax=Cryptomeria japonica TaxID=3369 RepID=UPI0027D9E6E4|nr:LOW QUALITY PROTEIN: (+)-neomenthol dehydrogenase [Cryptomeria japonica]
MDSSESLNKRWWKEGTVGVVTGANKGIGYAVVHQLAEHGIHVILTARDEERGKAAVKTLNDEGFHNVVFHQLDVHDESSIQAFANWMNEKHGKLDILVNNAAISGLTIDYDIVKKNKSNPTMLFTPPGSTVEGISETYEMAKECIEINYYGTKRMVEAFLPLLKLASEGGGRIVNVTSRAGVLEYIPSMTLRQQLSNLHDLTEDKIDAFLQKFLKDFKKGMLKINGWPISYSAYFVSKAAQNAYTRLLAHQHPDMYINCVHPGFVKTDLNVDVGKLSIDEGAKGPVMVALHPPGSPSGQYYDETEIGDFNVLPKTDGP